MGMATVGLSILLETHHHHHRSVNMNTTGNTKILSKFSLTKPPPPPPSPPSPRSSSYYSPVPSLNFLDSCYLCKRDLLPGKDIYMYRGDHAFCSVECRCKQIFSDEIRENCGVTAVKVKPISSSSTSTSPPRYRRERRNRAGGLAF